MPARVVPQLDASDGLPRSWPESKHL